MAADTGANSNARAKLRSWKQKVDALPTGPLRGAHCTVVAVDAGCSRF
jgi:hypothetical protein